MTTLVETQGLTKRYGSSRGIEDVSFTINEGEVFGFLGPNGAGKTTTIRTLMGLLRPTAGSARIGGLDCWDQSVEVKRLVG
ncbi:MAG TPA: ATP-binding cassette domain-containing protein, partial [Ktedonobacterales bacterium]|nr:ATP-binding cassette domain-containing protein [Ktedonobacterales bacterium]